MVNYSLSFIYHAFLSNFKTAEHNREGAFFIVFYLFDVCCNSLMVNPCNDLKKP